MIKSFLQFLQAYDGHQVHNMLAIMFDPCFKSLKVVENYVGHGACIRFTFVWVSFRLLEFQNMNDDLHLKKLVFCVFARFTSRARQQ
jgi:hypothetical protein